MVDRRAGLYSGRDMLANAVDTLRSLVQGLITVLDYPGIALVMVAVMPELVMPFAGFLVATGQLSFMGVLVAGTLGSVAGSLAIYALARWLGEPRVRSFFRGRGRWLLLHERDLDRVLRLFDRYDDLVLLFGRFIPTVRSLISVPAGLLPLAPGRFLLLTATGALILNTVLTYAGIMLGRNWQQILVWVEIYEALVWTVLAVMLLLFVARRLKRRSLRPEARP